LLAISHHTIIDSAKTPSRSTAIFNPFLTDLEGNAP
jgi:hypothetical protein